MSQLDLIAELRANRPVAPVELRARVRDLAASAPAPRRRFTWKRALVVAIAVAGLAAVAGVLGTRDGGTGHVAQTLAPQDAPTSVATAKPKAKATRSSSEAFALATAGSARAAAPPSRAGAVGATVPPPSVSDAQRYSA